MIEWLQSVKNKRRARSFHRIEMLESLLLGTYEYSKEDKVEKIHDTVSKQPFTFPGWSEEIMKIVLRSIPIVIML